MAAEVTESQVCGGYV
jgi:hypothetical protein